MQWPERRTSAQDPLGRWAPQAFPNMSIDVPPVEHRSTFTDVTIGECRLIRLKLAGGVVDLSGAGAIAQGIGDHAKLVWQLSGQARVVDRSSDRVLTAGDVALMPLRRSYALDLSPDYEALLLFFDLNDRPLWRDLADQGATQTVHAGSAAAAARACAASLIEYADGRSGDAIALEACFGLMSHALIDREDAQPTASSHRLRMATGMVEQHLADRHYGPEALARDLGRSRRSLYEDFAALGTTPAAFIKGLRLRRAKDAILGSGTAWGSLTEIALRCGFSDSASFSHAFRKAFAVSPSSLLKAKLGLVAPAAPVDFRTEEQDSARSEQTGGD